MALVAGLKRTTDEGSLPEIAQYSPYYLPLNVLLLPKDQTFIFYLLLPKELTFIYFQIAITSEKEGYPMTSYARIIHV